MSSACCDRKKQKNDRRTAEVILPRGIRKRSSGRYLVDVTIRGIRKTVTADTLEDALIKRAELIEETKSVSSQGAAWTLRNAYERTLVSCWIGRSFERDAIRNGEEAIAFFGEHTAVKDIQTDDLDKFVAALIKRGNSNGTINRKLAAISKIIRFAAGRGQVERMPLVPRRREREGRIRFLTLEEEKELLQAFRGLNKIDHLEATVVLLDTGFRTGELWSIEAGYVNREAGTITLWRTKSGKPRTIPMTDRVREIILQRCSKFPTGKLFPGASNDWYQCQWRRIRQILKKTEDTEYVPHMLRHTCCSRLVQRGVPLTHVQAWMGHRVIQTTQRYAHLAPHDLFSAVTVLNGGASTKWEGSAFQIDNPPV